MRLALLLLLFLANHAAHALGAPEAQWLRELDRDIWVPFVDGVSTFDDAGYLATRSRDFVMVDRAYDFLDYAWYAEDSAKSMRELRASGVKLVADVRFQSRHSDGDYASEQGLLRIARTNADGKAMAGITRFHAISRREPDGRWRVLTEHRWADNEATQARFDALPAR